MKGLTNVPAILTAPLHTIKFEGIFDLEVRILVERSEEVKPHVAKARSINALHLWNNPVDQHAMHVCWHPTRVRIAPESTNVHYH